MRAEGDPAVIERGKALYGSLCRACHGGDLRGGDIGGPNLLRSQLVLNDQGGELITPVIKEGRTPAGGGTPMPPQQLPDADYKAIAEYIHSVARTTQPQGGPPRGEAVELNLLVGNAKAGERYFRKECADCHSITGDLAGIGTRVGNVGQLQDSWVGGRRAPAPNMALGPAAAAPAGDVARRTPRVTVKFADGSSQTGRLARIDDFVVSFTGDDGVYRSYTRRAVTPKIVSVTVDDPLARHRALWTKLTDKDMHDVTAYLASLK
jgi:cytochrome c oxidase cbb3-type subunit 3